jgi:DNA-directed RNA polymerase subunit RPC12/RpoP
VQLIIALENVFDDCERVLIKLLSFQSKLLVAKERMETLKASFVAWYALAAQQYLSSYDIDLSKMVIADLAKAEFERLILGLDVEVNSLIAAVAVQVKTVQKRKQTAQEKFNLGKDQANAVWTGTLLPANIGNNSDEGGRALLEEAEEEEETVPEFVSNQPKVGSTCCKHFKEPFYCQECRDERDQIRGVFVKRGDPVIAEPIGETELDEVTCMECNKKSPIVKGTKQMKCPHCKKTIALFPVPKNGLHT